MHTVSELQSLPGEYNNVMPFLASLSPNKTPNLSHPNAIHVQFPCLCLFRPLSSYCTPWKKEMESSGKGAWFEVADFYLFS